jgi:hypothetical protein
VCGSRTVNGKSVQGLRPKPLRGADRVAVSNERWRMARHSVLKECTESRSVGVKESDLQQLSSPRKQVITSLPYRSCFVFRDTSTSFHIRCKRYAFAITYSMNM